MLPRKLVMFDYYKKKLTMLLNSCYGLDEHLKIFFDVLQQCDYFADYVFKLLDVTDKRMSTDLTTTPDVMTNLEVIASLPDVVTSYKIHDAENDKDIEVKVPYGLQNQFLDMIAEIVGTKRHLSVEYVDPESLKTVKKDLNLDNAQLLRLIKVNIVQNNYAGTREQIEDLYKTCGLKIYQYNNDTNLPNTYKSADHSSCTVYLCLDEDQFNAQSVSDGVLYNKLDKEVDEPLFLAGMYTIRSMGLSYSHLITNVRNVGIWDFNDPEDPKKLWGKTEDGKADALWG